MVFQYSLPLKYSVYYINKIIYKCYYKNIFKKSLPFCCDIM